MYFRLRYLHYYFWYLWRYFFCWQKMINLQAIFWIFGQYSKLFEVEIGSDNRVLIFDANFLDTRKRSVWSFAFLSNVLVFTVFWKTFWFSSKVWRCRFWSCIPLGDRLFRHRDYLIGIVKNRLMMFFWLLFFFTADSCSIINDLKAIISVLSTDTFSSNESILSSINMFAFSDVCFSITLTTKNVLQFNGG